MTQCVKCHTSLPGESRFCSVCGADQTGGGADAGTSGPVELLQARLQRLIRGKYDVKRLLGKGGMGAVFLAQDLTLEREVAIKVLPPDYSTDPQVIKRFQQEAKTAAKLDHPNIIPIYRVESEDGLNYFVMKYISGTSLEDVLETEHPLSYDYVQRILWEAACALGHAHSRGVVHRDVKPANIMFDHDGRVMLTDFGISKALQGASGLTGTGMIIGTPHYMAPEQAKGQPVDGRADQYSLGIVGYRLLAGTLPFSGDSVHTILYKHIFEEAPRVSSLRPGIPKYLTEPIQRALSKEASQRYATMEDFATAVWPEQALTAGKATPRSRPQRPTGPETADEPTEVTPQAAPRTRTGPAAPVRAARKSSSKLGLWIAIGVAVVGVGGYFALRGGGSRGGGPDSTAATPTIAEITRSTAAGSESSASTISTPTDTTAVTPSDTTGGQIVELHRASPADARPGRAVSPPAPRPATAGEGYLSIDSDPTGELYLDGVDVGPTPLFRRGVSPGRHTVRIEASGYRTLTQGVDVSAGATVTKRLKLNPE
jgi:serine/threonine protein kinase